MEYIPVRRAGHSRYSTPSPVGGGYSIISPIFPIKSRCTTHLTCSETNCVVPAASSHLPKKISPRNGFNGFFSLPNFSFLLLYCCLRVLRNHLSTSRARFSGFGSDAGATNSDGCSVQYAEYSTSEVVDRMNGGAVMEDRSPLKEAID